MEKRRNEKMQILIDITEDSYKATCNGYMLPSDVENVVQGIKNGTPLPKGHWINAEQKVTAQLYDDQYEIFKEKEMTIAECLDAYTKEGCPMSIIEADKEEE